MQKKSIAIIGLLTVCCALSQAQEKKDTGIISTLNEIVISANKQPENKNAVAQQVEVIDYKKITMAQAANTADLLSSVANVFVQKSQMGGGSPVLRGFEANRILLVVDGVRMNNIIYRGGHLQNVITVDNNMLNRVEILYGPSSTIYGSDALGGVISLYSQQPMFSPEGKKKSFNFKAFSRYTSVNNGFSSHVEMNAGTSKFANYTGITYSDFSDLLSGKNNNPFYSGNYGERNYYVDRINGKDSLVLNPNKYLQKFSGYNQIDVVDKIAFKQNDRVLHGLNIQYSTSSNVPRYDRLTDPSGSGLKYAEWNYGPQKRLLSAYDLNISNKYALVKTMHLGVNYQNIEESRITRKFNSTGRQSRIENVQVAGLNLDMTSIFGQQVFRYGIESQFNKLKSTANLYNLETGVTAPLDTRYPDGDNTLFTSGVYLSHSVKLNNRFSFNDGVRLGLSHLHSTFNDTSFFNFPFSEVNQRNLVYSGALGMVFIPNSKSKLSLLISSGYRAPNVDDLSKVFESAAGTLIVPNNNLKPEKTLNYELGYNQLCFGKVMLGNTVYYTDFFDAIVTDQFKYLGQDSVLYNGTMSKVLANQNKRRAYILGFNSQLKAQLNKKLLLSGGLNYTYGRIRTDSTATPLDHIPPFLMNAAVDYQMKKWAVHFAVQYNGKKKLKDYLLNGEDNEQYATAEGMPAWICTNVRLSYSPSKSINVTAGVDNIMDTQYRTFASGINAPGRNFFLTLRLN